MDPLKATTTMEQSMSFDKWFETSNIMTELKCPISMELMRDPVILVETGNTYDRTSITTYFEQGGTLDPLSGVPLRSQDILPNRSMKKLVQDVENLWDSFKSSGPWVLR